ncbi:uncharacterized protein K02A2.6-like, partial [Galendromus occidentalis]|uniref:Uncharacterized protein K02A2.6-like n=1 Tax=Galendromus occidentalis TaxID=34638 RepID=A0AAJ7PBJ8_9ACAR
LKDLNHPLPNMEEIMSEFSGSKVFSQLDLADTYLQLRLDEESQPYTTISTHRGLFKYKRLVFGLETAPAIFQKASKRLPDWKRLQEWGFHLRLEKCTVAQSKVKYLGLIVSERGIEADPKRISAIQALATPISKKEVRSLLGLVNYYGKFIRQLSGDLEHPAK